MNGLYDTDLLLWSDEQARALRAAARSGANLPIDWENVAEEIETLGKSLARELASRIATVLIHLMKLQVSPAIEPRLRWAETVREQRDEIERVLREAPSLRRTVADVIHQEVAGARKRVLAALADYQEHPLTDIASLTFTAEQVTGDWFPGP